MTGTYDASQVSRMTGATDRQLRYWRQIGLAVPSVANSSGIPGVWNFYSERDVERVRNIVEARKTMSLQQVRKVLAAENKRLAAVGRRA